MPVKIFCKECNIQMWWGMDRETKNTMTILEAEETCICSDCILKKIRE